MLTVHAAAHGRDVIGHFIEKLAGHDRVRLVGVSSTGSAVSDAVAADDFDALVFPAEWIDLVRSLRASATTNCKASYVVASDRVSTPLLARCLVSGFDAVVDTADDIDRTVTQITKAVNNEIHLEDHPTMQKLGLTRGLLARRLVIEDPDDQHVADLVGTGLPDEDIALLMDWSIQRVRNRVEHLLSTNDLAYRTQLAVLRASHLKVADLF